MSKKLISISTETGAWIYMLGATIWFILLLFFAALSFFTNSEILYFTPFLLVATMYCTYTATLHEISYDDDFIYVKSIFNNGKKFSHSDFEDISTKYLLLNTLKMNFSNKHSYSFAPRLKAKFFDFSFSAADDFIDHWSNYFKENKS